MSDTEQTEASKKQQIFARLLPYKPRKGQKVGKYCHHDGTTFQGGTNPDWYQVSPEQKEELRQLRQEGINLDDPDSKRLFQIVDGVEKEEIEAREQGLAMQGLGIVAATQMVAKPETKDVRPPAGRGAALPPPKSGGAVDTAAVESRRGRR